MVPIFHIAGKTVSIYQLTAIVGILLSGAFAMASARRKKLDDTEMLLLLLVSACGALVGAHLLYGITQIRFFPLLLRVKNLHQAYLVLSYLFGGSVFYGGLLGGLSAGHLYLRARHINAIAFEDAASPAIPLFHVFGRIGCFLGGCCYGIPCRFGFVYENAIVESANGVRRFPVQLAEAAVELLLFLVLASLLRKNRMRGRLLPLYLLSYSLARFGLEFLRGDEYRGFLWGLSTSQWISVFLLFVSAFLLYSRGKSRKNF